MTIHPQPAKEIFLRVPISGSSVDLKVTDNAGKVQVSVRSGDPDLARSIQSGIGDLVGHLEKKGFETETWVPSERAPVAPVAEPPRANTESGNSQQRSGGGTEQQGEGRQQGHGQGQRPKWLDEWEFGSSL